MAVSTLDFSSLLENKPTLSIQFSECVDRNDHSPMAANDDCVLLYSSGSLRVVGAQGKEYLNTKCDFVVNDMCWSCFQNKYLLLSGQTLYTLGAPAKTVQTSRQVLPEQLTELVECMKFSSLQSPTICTCSQDTFIVVDSSTSVIEVYTVIGWKMIQKYEQPVSCKKNQQLYTIRYNANGTRLGVVLKDSSDPQRGWFQLRHPYSMSVLKTVDLFNGLLGYSVIGLPICKDKFLLNEFCDKKFHLIDSYDHNDNQVLKMFPYQGEKHISDTILMNATPQQWLIVRKDSELCFYNVPRQ